MLIGLENIHTRSCSDAKVPIRVLFLGAGNAPGGVTGYINLIVNHLDSTEFDFHALCPGADGTRWFSKQITLHEFDGSYGLLDFPWRVHKLRSYLKSIDPDIIHLHTARAGLLGVFGAPLLLKKVVYTGHSWRFKQKANFILREIFRRIERIICARSDVITFLTRHELDEGVRLRLVDERKSIPINTRIQDGAAKDAGKQMDSNGEYLARGIVILNIGEVCERKNPMLFIEIAKRVISMRSDVRFEWIGEGVLREKVQQRVKEWGLSHAISFPGARDNDAVRSRISEAKVLLFTSYSEGVPLAVIEAKLTGLPVVASNYDGVEAIVRHGVDGLVFNLFNPDEGAQHLITLLSNSEIHALFSKEGREFGIAEHSRPEVMAAEFATIYRTLVGVGYCVKR